jgi:hypothetical protein
MRVVSYRIPARKGRDSLSYEGQSLESPSFTAGGLLRQRAQLTRLPEEDGGLNFPLIII